MSEIIQLYKDSNKTIKAYPKTLASEVYIDEENNIIQELDNKSNLIHTHEEYAIKTEVETAVNTKAPLTHSHEEYTTETRVQELIDSIPSEEVDLTNYYTKEETVSKIELEEKLISKANQNSIDAIWTEINGTSSLLDELLQTLQ